MAIAVIDEQQKFIDKLKTAKEEGKDFDEVFKLQTELPDISPENSQYPEGGSEAGGDSSILESQKLSFKL